MGLEVGRGPESQGGRGVNAPGLGSRRRHPRTSGMRLRSRKVLWRSPRVVTDRIGGGERAGEAGGRQPNPLPLRLRASVPGPRACWGHRSRAGGPVRPGDAAPEPGEAPSSRPRGWGGGGGVAVAVARTGKPTSPVDVLYSVLGKQRAQGAGEHRPVTLTHTHTPSRFGARSTLTRPGGSIRE